ncbi:conserved hypothetical protein [Ricinus communis]|uniref:Uncharacterized protein n=1 Tax=Ricinus communis TaxID=3988 RepID=B9T583_RICCO|nr:conserved hypothetical protein [Ricinus communis]
MNLEIKVELMLQGRTRTGNYCRYCGNDNRITTSVDKGKVVQRADNNNTTKPREPGHRSNECSKRKKQ